MTPAFSAFCLLPLLHAFLLSLLLLRQPLHVLGLFPCPTTCSRVGFSFLSAGPIDVFNGLPDLPTCISKCRSLVPPRYYFNFSPPSISHDCECFISCANAIQGFGYTTGYLPACPIPNQLNVSCTPGEPSSPVHGKAGIKSKCCFTNTNDTFPIVNYPFKPTTNFSPLLTDSTITSKGMAQGVVYPKSSLCFNYTNPADLGPANFSSPAPALTLASLTVSPTSAFGVTVACITKPTFPVFGNKVLAKFSCTVYNTLPRKVNSIVFTCTNFIPIFISGINKDCTISAPLKSGATASFSFQVLPADVTMTLSGIV